MKNKNAFFMGLFVGISLVLVGMLGFNVYARQSRWGGSLSPNEKVSEIFNIVTRFSIMEYDRPQMIENMYRGLVAGIGDPYSQYFDVEALQAFTTRTEGTFVGVGIRVIMDPVDRMLTIVQVFRDAPAREVGLRPDDRIIGVDGVDVIGRAQDEIMAMIRGDEGTEVAIEIFRPDENKRFEVTITRALVVVPSVYHELIETPVGRTGYIRIEAFERQTLQQFNTAMQELTAQDMCGLIIDVRNNPGGLMEVVTRITNTLVPQGVITFTEDVNGNREYHRSNATYLGLPLVVLINGRSASASEVLAGAVLDLGVGTLVGEQTFGKGSVQNLYPLPDNTAVKLTIAKYFTPNGSSIHGVGLPPCFPVEMDESLSRRIGDDLSIEEDVQLQIALRVLDHKR